jgi:hypothetical protein
MKLQFSLATLLVCMTVLAVVAPRAVIVRVQQPGHWQTVGNNNFEEHCAVEIYMTAK